MMTILRRELGALSNILTETRLNYNRKNVKIVAIIPGLKSTKIPGNLVQFKNC